MNFIITNFVFPRLHFLFYATLSLIVGICFQFFGISLLNQIIITFCVGLLGIWHHWAKEYHQTLIFIIPISILAGSLLCYRQQTVQKKFLDGVSGKTCCLQGQISSIEKIQNPRFSYRLILEAEHTFALYIKEKPDLLVADHIEVKEITFKQNTNEDFAKYLAKEKITATLFLEKFSYTLVQRPSFSLNRWLFYFKESLFATLQSKINRETFQLFSSIFLGNRTAVKKQMDTTKEPFKIWGTSHYLARSGLHLVIFVIIWHFLLSLLPLSYLFKQLFLIFLILAYALLSWSSVSFERALLMVLIYKWCILAHRPSHYVHLVVLATAIVLVINPLQLFFLDFQLSFGLTFALAWFNHIEARKKQCSV